MTRLARGIAVVSMAICGVTMFAATEAKAYGNLSCGQLWYERNAIFAQYGYCFKTQQAINTFGRRCYPPYGNLPASAQRRVNEITAWEQRKGCN